ncbi:MAG: Parvulin-like protein peptidyl-prolyl isomerase [Candidatus Amesbacteria bacterium GW2011_GWC2_45_19]|uniref:peptidylprolyl isomerase n=1 Tax=Candidatus Amesbacteria bacterium GW2011_GWC2_45_19 TaxID=1618366 RepID=A0A0G1M0G7_9BACT|nr:MAG: Parvulin-like protein peptidyl-prolyl isomerase [Candidatus Amesbacteria bacterium GW2011_GWC2_45_19]
MKQKSASSHRKPKTVDKGSTSDNWRQVLADIGQSLGFSGGSKSKSTKILPVQKEKQPEVTEASKKLQLDKPVKQDIKKAELVQVSEEQKQESEVKKSLLPIPHIHLSRRKKIILGLGVVLVILLTVFREDIFAPWPPAPNVVASYDGGRITIEDVEKHLTSLVEDEATQKQLKSPEGYGLIVQEMITDEIVRRWQTNRKPDQDKEFSHVMKHITEEINLNELHAQMHKGQLGVTEGDIGAYYEANKKDFGEKTLTDTREEIKTKLQSEKEDQFVQNYITGLKNKASITRDVATLAVPEPADWELRNYYDTNKNQYLVKAQAVVHEIRIPKTADEKKAKEKAEQALSKIRSGGDFAQIYQEIMGSPLPQTGGTKIKGEQDASFEEAIFRLDPEQISDVITDKDAFVIVRLVSKTSERQQSFEEVRSSVQTTVMTEAEKKYYTDNADRTLFTVNGKRFTLGEFWEEYQELPLSFLTSYSGTEGKQALVEKIIERLLLYEDSLSQVSQTDTKERKDEMRLKVLAQMLEQEEVDDKIKIEDKDLQDYYNRSKAELVMPAKSKVRQIVIRAGSSDSATDDEHNKAFEKASEAYKKLVPGPLKKGEDFASVAKQYSEDEATKEKGGEVTEWIQEEMDFMGEITKHQYHEQVQAIPKGQIGQPFEANGYIYIVEVTDRSEPEQLSFEDSKEFIRERLTQEKHQELSEQLSSKLMKDAKVVIYTRTLKKITQGNKQ